MRLMGYFVKIFVDKCRTYSYNSNSGGSNDRLNKGTKRPNGRKKDQHYSRIRVYPMQSEAGRTLAQRGIGAFSYLSGSNKERHKATEKIMKEKTLIY